MNWLEIKKRLKNMIVYDWMKIVALVVAIVVFWIVVFQTASTTVTSGQNFGIFFYHSLVDNTTVTKNFIDEKKCFSDNAIFRSYTQLMSESYFEQFMSTRIATRDGDIMAIDDDINMDTGGNFKAFVDSYGNVLYNYGDLINDGMQYLSVLLKDGKAINDVITYYKPETAGFDKQTYFNDNFDDNKIANLFRTRCKEESTLNKKYPSEGDKLKGIEEEKVRIKKLFEDVADFNYLFVEHSEMFVMYHRYTYLVANNPNEQKYKDYYDTEYEKPFGLNTRYIAENHGDDQVTKSNITQFFNTSSAIGEGHPVYLLVYNYKDYQSHEQYEAISFINMMVKECSTLLDSRR